MDFLSPDYPTDIPAADLIGDTGTGTQVRMVAVTTLTGSASVNGTSGPLGNDTDARLLQGLREWADVVLVGSGTVKKETYGPAGGETPIAVISRSLRFTGDEAFLHGPTFICTPRSSLDDPGLADRRDLLASRGAQLVSTGGGSAPEILAALTALGHRRISCEGGPGIYGLLLAADLVDVAHVTLAPRITAPVETPLVSARPDGGDVDTRLALDLAAPTADGTVFLRYRRRPAR